MKKFLLFLSSFIIAVGAAATVYLCVVATSVQRNMVRAAAGNTQAAFWVGYAYENGEGVEKDEAKARRFYRKAAEKGSDLAAVNLGLLLLKGQGGDKDERSALALFVVAANKGNAQAQMNAARGAFLGIGMEKDEAAGAAWVRKAAEGGSSKAAALMGILSLAGIGVPQDHDAAVTWLKKSRETEAKDLAARLEAQNTMLGALPPEARAEKWKEAYAQMEAGIRAEFERILESETAPGRLH